MSDLGMPRDQGWHPRVFLSCEVVRKRFRMFPGRIDLAEECLSLSLCVFVSALQDS